MFGYCNVDKIGGERKGKYFDFHTYVLKTLSWKCFPRPGVMSEVLATSLDIGLSN